MISVQDALRLVLADVPLMGSEMVGLTEACGRVLATAVQSSREVPSFSSSAMDGFAVRSADIVQGQTTLRVVETIGAGVVPRCRVEAGTAAKIMTGSVMPDGADTVVKVEDTSEHDDHVRITTPAPAGANVRYPGEDVRRGDVVLTRGRLLRPADIGLLASIGCSVVRVHRRPTVAIVATGDELVELGQPLRPGQIVNSNAYTLAAAVQEAGGLPQVLGIARDEEDATRAMFEMALGADIVLSTGGVSMGVFDLVRGILAKLGVVEEFWKVAQKPGKPLTFGRREGSSVFGLPGNPVSALVCFYIYVVPLLRTMMGLSRIHLPIITATCDEELRASNGLTDFIRCRIEGDPSAYRVRSTGTQSSGVLRSMSLGDGLIVAPPAVTVIPQGSVVSVLRLVDDPSLRPPV